MTVKSDNIKVTKYSDKYLKAAIIKQTRRQKKLGITLAVGIFDLKELEQWREVIKAYDRDKR